MRGPPWLERPHHRLVESPRTGVPTVGAQACTSRGLARLEKAHGGARRDVEAQCRARPSRSKSSAALVLGKNGNGLPTCNKACRRWDTAAQPPRGPRFNSISPLEAKTSPGSWRISHLALDRRDRSVSRNTHRLSAPRPAARAHYRPRSEAAATSSNRTSVSRSISVVSTLDLPSARPVPVRV